MNIWQKLNLEVDKWENNNTMYLDRKLSLLLIHPKDEYDLMKVLLNQFHCTTFIQEVSTVKSLAIRQHTLRIIRSYNVKENKFEIF